MHTSIFSEISKNGQSYPQGQSYPDLRYYVFKQPSFGLVPPIPSAFRRHSKLNMGLKTISACIWVTKGACRATNVTTVRCFYYRSCWRLCWVMLTVPALFLVPLFFQPFWKVHTFTRDPNHSNIDFETSHPSLSFVKLHHLIRQLDLEIVVPQGTLLEKLFG